MFSTVRGENMSQHNRGASDTDSDVQLAGSIVSEPTRIPTPQSSSTGVEVNEVILLAFSWLLFAKGYCCQVPFKCFVTQWGKD